MRQILDAALAAADPGRCVQRFLSVEGDAVRVAGESFEPRRVFALAVGKAAGPMAESAGGILGERMSGGLCVTKAGHEEAPPPFENVAASHRGP